MRRALIGVFAGLLLIAGTPVAGASPASRLAAARARLTALAAEIEQQAAGMQTLQADVATADARMASASARLGRLLDARLKLQDRLAAARTRVDRTQTRLNDLVAETFMGAPAGTTGMTLLGAVLGATSLGDIGDRLVFSSAGADAQAALAARLDAFELRLLAESTALDAVAAVQAGLLGRLENARNEKAAALAAEETAAAELDASRSEVVGLVSRLMDRLRAADLGGVGRAFQGAYHVSYGEWARRFLEEMALPSCRSNLVVVVAWQVQEFTQAAWNPLATTHRMPGSTDFNSVGVQNFVSLQQGLQATRETIDNGYDVYRYGAIVRSLAACADPMATALAVNASAWCSGCGNGSYLIGVVPKVEADYEAYAAL